MIPNPWDVGTARMLEHLGFRALATTSAGYAFTLGRPDTVSALSCDEVVAHARDLAEATSLPISVDFQDGYADTPEGVVENVAKCLATGAAGLSIEDAADDPEAPLLPQDVAIERVRAACAARDTAAPGAVITARCEAWLYGVDHADRVVRERLVAFADAGADCLFAPGVRDPEEIASLVELVAPKPLNVLMSAPHEELTAPRLRDLGVRRISVGSGFARAAWGAFMRAARAVREDGVFDGLSGAASFAELDRVFGE